jgi:hypothetical protein
MIFGNAFVNVSKPKLVVDVIDKLSHTHETIIHNYQSVFRISFLLLRTWYWGAVNSMCSNIPLTLRIAQLHNSTLCKKYIFQIHILLLTNNNSTCKEISNVDIFDSMERWPIGRKRSVIDVFNPSWQCKCTAIILSWWNQIACYYL